MRGPNGSLGLCSPLILPAPHQLPRFTSLAFPPAPLHAQATRLSHLPARTPPHTPPRLLLPRGRRSRVAFAATSQTGEGASDEEEAAGAVGLAALRSDHVRERRDRPPAPSPAGEGVPGGASGALRGSDVLQAIQRAVAEREARKVRVKKKQRRRATTDGGGDEAFDCSEQVRPIEIRNDWGRRIDELESRVAELRSQYH